MPRTLSKMEADGLDQHLSVLRAALSSAITALDPRYPGLWDPHAWTQRDPPHEHRVEALTRTLHALLRLPHAALWPPRPLGAIDGVLVELRGLLTVRIDADLITKLNNMCRARGLIQPATANAAGVAHYERRVRVLEAQNAYLETACRQLMLVPIALAVNALETAGPGAAAPHTTQARQGTDAVPTAELVTKASRKSCVIS